VLAQEVTDVVQVDLRRAVVHVAIPTVFKHLVA
jgi:hypothetical protein